MYYAEYLKEIKIFNIIIEDEIKLEDVKNVVLKSSKKVFIIYQDNTVLKVLFPLTSYKKLTLKSINRINEKIIKIVILIDKEELKNQEQSKITKFQTKSFITDSIIKWSCSDLIKKTPNNDKKINQFTFSCIKCNHALICSSEYKFIDMPSEYWYEFMDIWHCSKPKNQDKHYKNYNGNLKPPDDLSIILGSYYIILTKNNNLVKKNDEIICKNCYLKIGIFHTIVNSFKIFKWNLILQYRNVDKNIETERFSSKIYLYNLIIDKINLTALRRFKFRHKERYWFFWVLNIGANVSLSGKILEDSLKLSYFNNINDDPNDLICQKFQILDIDYPEFLSDFILHIEKINALLPSFLKNVVLDSTNYKISYFSQEVS